MDKDNSFEKIGKHISILRKSQGLTQKELADKIYVSDKTVSKWERGIALPDITLLKELSVILKVSIEEIATGEKVTIKEKSDDATISIVKLYTKTTRKKYVKKLLFFIAFFLLFLTIFLIIDNHYKWRINRFSTRGEISVSGYSFKNNIESKVILEKIIFDDKNAGTIDEIKTNSLKISIFSKEHELCSRTSIYSSSLSLSELLYNYSFVCEIDGKTDLDNLTLHLYYQSNGDEVSRKIKL